MLLGGRERGAPRCGALPSGEPKAGTYSRVRRPWAPAEVATEERGLASVRILAPHIDRAHGFDLSCGADLMRRKRRGRPATLPGSQATRRAVARQAVSGKMEILA